VPQEKKSKKRSISRKPSKSATTNDASQKNTCFVLMPYGGWFDQYYDDIYCPAIEDGGLTPNRADDLYRPGTIINDIWTLTQAAKLILADLSGRNPNVFYELGLAHALAKPAILVTDSIESVPFDLRALRVIEYDKNEPNWGDVLKDKITIAIQEVLKAPLEAVLPAFLKVDRSAKPGTVTEPEKAILELRRDFDLLRREIRLGSSIERRERFGPSEALLSMRRWLKMGMPKEVVMNRLLERGAPKDWIIKHIDRYQLAKQEEVPSSDSEVKKE
jgi:hypothetical protein